MCMIIAKPKGIKLPDKETILRCAIDNRDGIGVAYLAEDGIRIKKDFENEYAFWVWASENLSEDIPAIIHYRMATHGKIDKGNRHPFPVTQDVAKLRETSLVTDLAVAHNGVLYDYSHKEYSDTQCFIMEVLAAPEIRENLSSPAVTLLIEKFIENDRLAFLDAKGEIKLIGQFIKDNGLFYSNSGFRDRAFKGFARETTKIPEINYYSEEIKEGRQSRKAECIECKRMVKKNKLVSISDDLGDSYYLCKGCYAKYNY